MKILITGATGKIGYNLLKYLKPYHSIATLSRSPIYKTRDIKQYIADITDKERILAVIKEFQPSVIVHLAGLVGKECYSSSDLTNKVNIEATENLYSMAVKNNVEQFIFASTSAVYTQKDYSPTKETENIHPKNKYGLSKYNAEKRLEALYSTKTNINILRLFNVYGPDFHDSLIYKLTHPTDVKLRILDPKMYFRDYIHINDVLLAIRRCIEVNPHGYNVFNIATGEAYSTEELINELEIDLNSLKMELIPLQSLDITWADISKARTALGFVPDSKIIIND